jgi:hypothetical protein
MLMGADNLKKKFVRFERYCEVHVRIAKKLSDSDNFDLADARKVAKEDFFSDTGGDSKMSRSQLEVRGSRSPHLLREKSGLHARVLTVRMMHRHQCMSW